MDESLSGHLTRLSGEVDLQLEKEGDQLFHLKVGSIALTVERLQEILLFFSPIGTLPHGQRERLLTLLMKANFLGQGTGGATLSLDNEEKTLTLSLSMSYDLGYKTFREAIEDFVNYVDYWQQEIVRHARESI